MCRDCATDSASYSMKCEGCVKRWNEIYERFQKALSERGKQAAQQKGKVR